jgi:hypothetical protein
LDTPGVSCGGSSTVHERPGRGPEGRYESEVLDKKRNLAVRGFAFGISMIQFVREIRISESGTRITRSEINGGCGAGEYGKEDH